MIELLKLTISGFKSYLDSQTLDLSEPDGLYYITGRNDVEPRLGANGTGKSSIPDAIRWILFGDTSGGQRGSEVETWGAEAMQCYGRLDMRLNGKRLAVMRTRRPTQLALKEGKNAEPRTITQAELDQLLGVRSTVFSHTTILAQGGTTFVDMPPNERLKLLTDALDLQPFEAASNLAKDRAKELRTERSEAQASMQRLAGQREEVLMQVAHLRKRKEDLKDSSPEDTSEVEQFIALRVRNISNLTARMRKMGKREAIEQRFSQADDAYQAQRYAEGTAEQNELSCRAAYERKKQEHQEAVRSSRKDNCPTCGQSWEAAKQHAQALFAERDNLFKEHKRFRKTARTEAYKTARLKEKVEHLGDRLDAWDDRRTKLSRNLADAKRRRQDAEDALERSKAGGVTNELTRIDEDVSKVKARARALEDEKEDWRRKSARLDAELEALEFWVQGFKDVRLFAISQAVEHLRIAIESIADSLGLANWDIMLDVNKKNAKGTVTPGIVVEVKPVDATEHVTFRSLSGGEQQRVRLAVALGVAELLRERSGFRCSLEFWDEPTDGLSDAGVMDILHVMNARARDRKVYLIDHRALDSAHFAGSYRVTKTGQGSTIARTH